MSSLFRIATRPVVLAVSLVVFLVTRTVALVVRLVSFTATRIVPGAVRAAAYLVVMPLKLIAFLATSAARLLRSIVLSIGWLASLLGGYALFIADLVIYLMVRAQGGGQRVKPTRRRPFEAGQKELLFRSQVGRCMYCGAERDIREFQIDHMVPVVRGGPHEMANFQLLCGPCNNRKRDYTDDEFRQRFRELTGPPRGGRGGYEPPREQIPLDRFEEVSLRSHVPQSLQDFHSMEFRPPLGKVAVGCAVVGLVALVVWIAVAVVQTGRLSPDGVTEEWRMMSVAVAGYAAASLALVWRAYVIGSGERDR
ncbi:MAG: HNH endonuclease [Chloroflexota bacterium]|nr:HNH endonuclease [Chloroflexota bacterium]MDE2942037.1 HNH endonuclease [Chloroflexota bacterium]MDE3266905.1 HNH endonuclease [Chloroflexota bacterium]